MTSLPDEAGKATLDFTSRHLDDTDRIGESISAALHPGDVLSLSGPLGAGKTRLVQAIAEGLGIAREQVTSPTFVLLNEYRTGRLPLYHFDVYRLRDEDEFFELGPEEYFSGEGVTLLEWGDRVGHLLPPRTSRVTIEVLGPDERAIRIAGPLAARLQPDLR
jgi:tRNA threonylcarbamoyladenosine biosynthesis protein TsaE